MAVRNNPYRCCEWLEERGLTDRLTINVARHDRLITVFDVRFDAPPAEHLPGYPPEHVRITIRHDGAVFAVPVRGDDRMWLHRYPHYTTSQLLQVLRRNRIPWEHLVGSLCLEYPSDPAHLRWHWADGIDAYFRIVQRHLWFEEYHRRHGSWPVEDAPHGEPVASASHPVRTLELRRAS